MKAEKMTIHRALAELKLIDNRISKSIADLEPSGIMQKGKKVNHFYEEKEFKDLVTSKYQSVLDLMERKRKIKSAIVQANSKTSIKINNKKMSIADAINFKTLIEAKQLFISNMAEKHNRNKAFINKENQKVEEKALKLAEAAMGKDNVKVTDKDVKAIYDPFIENNQFLLVNPLDIEKKLEALQQEIDSFLTEVDAVLSETNATTFIEI